MSNKVTYAEIIDALAAKTGFSKQKSEAFSKALVAQIKDELRETGKASITNFGSFKVKRISQRQGQNPQTGEPITIPAHNRVSFTPYKALKETVNAKYAHLETELVGEQEEAETLEEIDVGAEENESSGIEGRERTKQGINTGLMLITLLLLVIVAIASVWFLMGPSTESPSQMQAGVEHPQTPKTVSKIPAKQKETDKQKPDETSKTKPPTETSPQQAVLKQDEKVVSKKAEKPSMYQVKKGEWYWVISEKVYGRSNLWPLLFQKNQAVNDDPDKLYPSTGLEIPALEGTANKPSPSDYTRLAEASRMVSQAYLNFGKTEKAEDYARLAKKWEKLRRANK
jgi:DNA-binding protein HU-beta